ncbi:hypothetical protein V501_03252 [Pseudogymnoascus sp. VKM F-4519 (FW-2642)]|nr:hypothetical protein V499_08414 [Pseudogymnoascus sp. VKM F-103]KFZ14434.1 hypothetical protein V501_03252 [Pseudogymnoascus sp. VKM F-4519 (FW-2642)]
MAYSNSGTVNEFMARPIACQFGASETLNYQPSLLTTTSSLLHHQLHQHKSNKMRAKWRKKRTRRLKRKRRKTRARSK